MRKFIAPLLIFFSAILIYTFIYPNPRNWYDHYKYLARSFLAGRVDIPNLPPFYQDSLDYQGKKYLPFPPLPALILAPIVYLNAETTQQQVSVIIGSINAVLVFLLLKRFTRPKNAVILSSFFAFGTVAFWSAVVGTTWYFSHSIALTFLISSLLAFKSKKYAFSGFLFSLAVLSRLPVFLGIIFFILELKKDRDNLLKFLSTAMFCIPATLFYNWLRFDNIFHTGYPEVYRGYVESNIPFSFFNFGKFDYLTVKNIPLHLITFLAMPPFYGSGKILPSPYGMGIIFTSPLLLIAFLPPFQRGIVRNLFWGALAIAIVDFLHYAQGWVQFGYRFLLDFLPFLLIILAIKFKPSKVYLFLLGVSIFVNFWGVILAIKLGW